MVDPRRASGNPGRVRRRARCGFIALYADHDRLRFSGVLLGRLIDRFGILLPLIGGTVVMCLGYLVSSLAPNLLLYALAQGLLVGGGTAVFLRPS